jgi:hypothetical protein
MKYVFGGAILILLTCDVQDEGASLKPPYLASRILCGFKVIPTFGQERCARPRARKRVV